MAVSLCVVGILVFDSIISIYRNETVILLMMLMRMMIQVRLASKMYYCSCFIVA